MNFIDTVYTQALSYGVNPLIFAAIYFGAMPFFIMSVGLIYSYKKQGRSILFPVLASSFFLISAYIYVIVAGKNVPVWVYGFVVCLIVYSLYKIRIDIKRKIDLIDKK